MQARLVVDPRVVQLAVKQRALEAFDDRELRIESGLDRKLAQKVLAERMDRLRAQRFDAPELRDAGAVIRVALSGRNFEQRRGGTDRPRNAFAGIESQRELGERLMNAIGDLARRFFREGDEDDALRRQRLVAEQQPQHLGHDRGGLAGAGAGFDDDVAAPRFVECECRLDGDRAQSAPPPRSVRGSLWRVIRYFSAKSWRVRQE